MAEFLCVQTNCSAFLRKTLDKGQEIETTKANCAIVRWAGSSKLSSEEQSNASESYGLRGTALALL